MLRQVTRVLAVLMLFTGVAVAPSVAAPVSAVADPCTGGGGADNDGNVGGEVTCPGEDGDDGDDGSDSSGVSNGSGGEWVCRYSGKVIPCVTSLGVYNGSCYIKLANPQPPKDAGIWNGKDEGYIVQCTPPRDECIEGMDDATEFMYLCAGGQQYSPDLPPTDMGPTPEELAERAYARMQLTMGEIGSTPPTTEVDGNAIGIVGMPIWLWVSNPAANTTGPIRESETDGGLTVTVDGTLDRIVWTLTDDDTGEVYATTTCAGSRAPYTEWSEAASGGDARPSPTCGFDGAENRRSGNITVTGTAYWTAEWEGGGLDGTIDVPAQTRESTLAIGEAQVLVQ
ncbi:hypothetical protein ACFQ8T_12015 [Isoptericola sp. NPDC056618]|uniref:hypothetical protein n=1 Tax=Isoptericola sp. NPDC056618 TaxID=3345878 RepID=UPI00367B82FD